MKIDKLLRRALPDFLKKVYYIKFYRIEHSIKWWEKEARFPNIQGLNFKDSPYPFKLCVIKEKANYHENYIKACYELKVNCKLVDIFKDRWIDEFKNADCDAFLVWPSVNLTIWKELFDERLKILVDELKKIIFPSYKEIWLYENKRRVRDWLLANNIPHPETWIFYSIEEALEFLSKVEYPIVRKTALGAAALGVKILRNFKEASKDVKKIFKKGIVPYKFDPRDKQWGYVIFQEYIPHEYEWRVVRVGDYFMVRKKIKLGEFASGSGEVIWGKPSLELLDFADNVTETGNFKSISVDIFETPHGFLVNELQALWGDIKPENIFKGAENMGRYSKDKSSGKWIFEKGYFYKNACANLRVQYVMSLLEKMNKRESVK